MPPQWQGSEDILVPPPGELEAEEEVEEEDVVNGDEDDGEATVDGEDHREENPPEKYSAGVYERDRELPDSEDELAL